ncbi:hypothetical protein SmJEL517_g02005 [Synchytrium microbalum]|uniref:Ubiquitin-activating enzyme E1-like n=1 Tax=Synchytrium microbalum TaxID=1806994 RepID=A0A507CE19_9FUNG|nr:uncharacterized protein SmJEL517_g02005 [Synchytrium microbalum]TPX35763.1 hypothetical protein SmJEL517_g02005 [Synchytrium microbalum]
MLSALTNDQDDTYQPLSPNNTDKNNINSMSHHRLAHLEAALGSSTLTKISSARVLMVGAGGIGCELLKNLVLSGFGDIEIVDLDTIDLSNLNRQFLFQKHHISKSKAQVARESALKFNPSVTIKAHHANIMDAQFDIKWFKSFDIVMNALDNKAARSYVNMMCLASNRILIESGTAGYLGQVTVHKKGVTECWDCEAKPVQKTFPVCTIRSTPSAPIHCIVWGKSYLFTQLFGREEMEDSIDSKEDAENSKEIETLKKEASALKRLKASAGSPEYAESVFKKVFTQDIERLISMDDMWKSRKPPTPLKFEEIVASSGEMDVRDAAPRAGLERDQNVWSLVENVAVFMQSLDKLATRCIEDQKADPEATIAFDKDDDDALDFVTAICNLRAIIYGIEPQSRFKVKELAGNIIPAIATTNAIIAGAIVLKAFQVLSAGNISACKYTFLTYAKETYIAPNALPKPNPECTVCSTTYHILKLDPSKITLGFLLQDIISADKPGLGMAGKGEISIQENGRLLYDVDFDDNVDTSLEGLGIKGGKLVSVVCDGEDEEGEYQISVSLMVDATLQSNFEVQGNRDYNKRRKPIPALTQPDEASLKRKAEEDKAADTKGKKPKVDDGAASNQVTETEVIYVDDDDTIVLD